MGGACYLLRFDDLCPSMAFTIWNQLEEIMRPLDIKPMLSVIPDNKDSSFFMEPVRGDFWQRVRRWKEQGWAVGVHGYQHRVTTGDPGLLGINPFSEFAGLTLEDQEEKIRLGLDKFRSEGVEPDFWCAPGHSFDHNTEIALRSVGFRVLSDGMSCRPFRSKYGLTWVPQQLWSYKWRPFGVWTICLHFNRWTVNDIEGFKLVLGKLGPRLTSLQSVLASDDWTSEGAIDRVFSKCYRPLVTTGSRIKSLLR